MKRRLVKKYALSVANAIKTEKRITGTYANTLYGRLLSFMFEDCAYFNPFEERAKFNKNRHYFLSSPADDPWTDEDIEDYSVWVNKESNRLSRKAEMLARARYAEPKYNVRISEEYGDGGVYCFAYLTTYHEGDEWVCKDNGTLDTIIGNKSAREDSFVAYDVSLGDATVIMRDVPYFTADEDFTD